MQSGEEIGRVGCDGSAHSTGDDQGVDRTLNVAKSGIDAQAQTGVGTHRHPVLGNDLETVPVIIDVPCRGTEYLSRADDIEHLNTVEDNDHDQPLANHLRSLSKKTGTDNDTNPSDSDIIGPRIAHNLSRIEQSRRRRIACSIGGVDDGVHSNCQHQQREPALKSMTGYPTTEVPSNQ